MLEKMYDYSPDIQVADEFSRKVIRGTYLKPNLERTKIPSSAVFLSDAVFHPG